MLDKAALVDTESTRSALSHLAFCALAALGLARQDGIVGTPYAENLFIIRWLASAQKQKRFPKSVAIDISLLQELGRKHAMTGKLRQHLECLWYACCGDLGTQSDLFRLTYATDMLKDQGWSNYVMNTREWKSGILPTSSEINGFYVEKTMLNAAFAQNGNHLHPVRFRLTGDAASFIHIMAECGLSVRLIDTTPNYHTAVLEPA